MAIDHAQAVSAAPETLMLLTTRGAPLEAQRQRLRLFAAKLGLAVADERVFRRRRRGGVGEQIRAVVPAGISVVLIEQLTALGKEDPFSMLMAAAELRSFGTALVSASTEEAWLIEIGPLLPALGGWLAAARRSQRRTAARAAISRARADGRRIGRPRRDLGDADLIRRLVGDLGVAGAATKLACGETTLRRFLKAAAPPPPPPLWLPLNGMEALQ